MYIFNVTQSIICMKLIHVNFASQNKENRNIRRLRRGHGSSLRDGNKNCDSASMNK